MKTEKKMEVVITSEELVKPSVPTPKHLRTFKLSLLDQLIPSPHVPVILFYPATPGDVMRKLDLLKKSLSPTLARFYPLAGKIRVGEGLYIECDDEGARFVEASVNMSLPQFLADPDLALLNKLIPCEYSIKESPLELEHPTNIQVSVFQCGGLAIAMCNTHKLHDGAALGAFLKEWAAFARGGEGSTNNTATVQDLAVAGHLFPASDLCLRDLAITTMGSMCKMGTCATKRFLFGRPAIEALKARGKGPNSRNPTRVEAVSGFLWKCVMTAAQGKNNGLRRPSTFTHMVNIRKRMHPPMPECSIGNLLCLAAVYCKNTDSYHVEGTFPSLVSEMRGAISKIDGNFLLGVSRDKSLMSSYLNDMTRGGSSDTVDHIVCSSWCNFGFYDTDYGWGSPIWVSNVGTIGPVFINTIFLVDTRSGDGIEAWVTLDAQEMVHLQEDPELRAFASVNPSPLRISSKL